MNKKLQYTAALIVTVFISAEVFSQEVFNIDDYATHEICEGIMHDANGGLVPYADGDNNTITLCTVGGETQINLYFIGFNLSDGDILTIYDGVNTGAPIIGSYSGEVLLFETISSTNPDGCLTVNFTANNDGNTGDFSCKIICGVPCDFPVALMEAESDTLKICPGEEFTIDGSASYWTEGANLEVATWDLGDGTNNTTDWPVLSHSYNTPGGYRVRLYIEDDNECFSLNIPEIIVLVSTPYVFDLQTSAPLVCEGTEVFIGNSDFMVNPDNTFTNEAQNGNTVNWTESSTVDFGDGVYIPDNTGLCQYSEITFNQFGNAVIDDAFDFSQISFEMEHSFVGDIIINLICPDGSVMNIWPEAGGSGTYLGEPDENDDGVPGIGYEYVFSPNSTGGTWLEGMGGFGGTVPAGNYEPEGDWMDLEGCPLNGTWQLEICDVVGIDDGWVFSFGIAFAPDFYPEILTFTPVVGEECDSSYWETPNELDLVGANCDWAQFIAEDAGVYTFTYTVVNDFGCSYSQDITVNVAPEPIVTAADVFLCVAGVPMDVDVTNPYPGWIYQYQWSPTDGLSNPNIQNPLVTGVTEPTTYTVTVFPTFDENCIGSATMEVGQIDPPVVEVLEEFVYFCGPGTEVSADVPGAPNGLSFNYTWTPAGSFADNTQVTDGVATAIVNSISNAPFEVIVAAAPTSDAGCIGYDTLTLIVPDAPAMDPITDLTFCEGSNIPITAPDGTGYYYYWYFSEDGEDYEQVAANSAGTYTVNETGFYQVVVEEPICNFTSITEYVVVVETCVIVIPNVFTPNGDDNNSTFEILGLDQFPSSTIRIYNRWGNLVYESDNYSDQWTGDDAAEGTYFFVLGVKKGGSYEYYEGHLTLLRD